MSFKTNIWEDGIKWNGVVYPARKSQLKPYSDKTNNIRPAATYKGKETGDIAFDIETHASKSQEKQSFAITEIDRIKALDVPWKCYLGIFVGLLAAMAVGCYFVAMNLRIETGALVGIYLGFLVALVLLFGLITFYGFKAEEIRDVEKLCQYYNQIKTERVQQHNYLRLNQKLENMNWGRTEADRDSQFLYRYNQVRTQSNMLVHAAAVAKEPALLAELFTRIHLRMWEVLFENAGFIKRVHTQICGIEEWKAAGEADKCKIVHEAFAVHVAVRVFANDELTNYKQVSLLAGDNLRELIYKCNALLDDASFRACVAKLSNCEAAAVDCAFKEQMRSPEEMKERLGALNKVFSGLVESQPKREYKRVRELGDLEDN